MLGEMLQKMC